MLILFFIYTIQTVVHRGQRMHKETYNSKGCNSMKRGFGRFGCLKAVDRMLKYWVQMLHLIHFQKYVNGIAGNRR